jgi:hypothetical protein
VTSYLVEAYVGASTPVTEVEERTRAATDEFTRTGASIRYLRSILIRQDEMCLHMFEADSIDTVRAVAAMARLEPYRIVEAEL